MVGPPNKYTSDWPQRYYNAAVCPSPHSSPESIVTDFRIWGRIEHIGVRDFYVVASAIPEAATERPIVLTVTAGSLEEANAVRAKLMVQAGDSVRVGGGRVVDVESDCVAASQFSI